MSLHQLSARVHALPALQAGEMGGSVAGQIRLCGKHSIVAPNSEQNRPAHHPRHSTPYLAHVHCQD